MKRIIAFLLAALLMCLFCAAGAEGTDFAVMSDDELHALVDGARNELAKRELTAAEGTVLFEQEGVTVYLTGEHEVKSGYLDLEAVVVNDRDCTVAIAVNSASINGWNVFSGGIGETSPGKKQKGMLSFSLEDASLSSFEEIEEIEEIELSIDLIDEDTYESIAETSEPITLHFNAD